MLLELRVFLPDVPERVGVPKPPQLYLELLLPNILLPYLRRPLPLVMETLHPQLEVQKFACREQTRGFRLF